MKDGVIIKSSLDTWMNEISQWKESGLRICLSWVVEWFRRIRIKDETDWREHQFWNFEKWDTTHETESQERSPRREKVCPEGQKWDKGEMISEEMNERLIDSSRYETIYDVQEWEYIRSISLKMFIEETWEIRSWRCFMSCLRFLIIMWINLFSSFCILTMHS